MKTVQTTQDNFLQKLCIYEIKISIFLLNGIRLEGYIQSFDQYSICLKSSVNTVIYKQAICSILPLRDFNKMETIK